MPCFSAEKKRKRNRPVTRGFPRVLGRAAADRDPAASGILFEMQTSRLIAFRFGSEKKALPVPVRREEK